MQVEAAVALASLRVKDSFQMMPPGAFQLQPHTVSQVPQLQPGAAGAIAGAAMRQMMSWLPQMTQAETDYSQIPGYRKGMEKPLTTASIPLYKLPKCRLTEMIEFVCEALDCTLTASLDQLRLALIVWG